MFATLIDETTVPEAVLAVYKVVAVVADGYDCPSTLVVAITIGPQSL
jgi:hypothetical protein